ncbi:mechanosensitive ion channel family protein [Aquibacillus koreensis]|uniref:Mechanosensing system component YbdG n=1 Tax=Aquibacillus koreensis TaxID=279446 RepID=A0A9X4AJQ1_9BACI|nr:mechanosensitive ion channel family protein [Aquibacillus koreensis]MCT2535411.1 mechanosensitive ion channel family protein [Aquibacillus koreensis]MDC3422246.1 mechanosensitive ion channel family protein [Aquibacillus koreensis]
MKYIEDWLVQYDMSATWAGYLANIIMILLIGIICIIANFITKKVVIRVISHYVKRNKFTWDDILLERKVFHKLSHIVPAIIIIVFATTTTFFSGYNEIIERGAIIYIIMAGLMVIFSLLNAINDIYQTFEIAKLRPIKGYLQVANIIVIIVGVVLVISILVGESPFILLSGIGALSAVILLIFKDSILGLVAGIQLAANDMVRVGDWIEMPKYGADGDIIDISLVTVKVQNWDKTITTIPSYALVSDSFINWRGMQDAGGRRIMRSLFIDKSSITFLSKDMIESLKSIHYLSEYLLEKEEEIEAYNTRHDINDSNTVNRRSLTNIGVFRAYIQKYLEHHPQIKQDMTLMVRQLAPTEHGLPLEIYAFTNDIRWHIYEGIQSDIFDHLFAVAPEFGIRLFQNPSGNDFRNLT